MQLKTVVLPAPFGPISAVMCPRSAAKLRSSIATRPPKRMLRWSTVRMGASSLIRRLPLALLHHRGRDGLFVVTQMERRFAGRNQAARPPDHDQHHGEAEHQHPVGLE